MKTNRITNEHSDPAKALQQIQKILSEKSGLQRRIEGVIRRLLDTDEPDEMLVADEIKAAVRVIFSHLTFTNGDLNDLIAQAKIAKENHKVRRGWIAVNVASWRVLEIKKLARSSGMTFRLFCEFALISAANELREQLGLSPQQARNLTDAQICSLAERSRLFSRVIQTSCPAKN